MSEVAGSRWPLRWEDSAWAASGIVLENKKTISMVSTSKLISQLPNYQGSIFTGKGRQSPGHGYREHLQINECIPIIKRYYAVE